MGCTYCPSFAPRALTFCSTDPALVRASGMPLAAISSSYALLLSSSSSVLGALSRASLSRPGKIVCGGES
jgi:hypothetical protein